MLRSFASFPGDCINVISAQVPVAELLARPAPTLHSPSVHAKKSSNFLQVPEIESPRLGQHNTPTTAYLQAQVCPCIALHATDFAVEYACADLVSLAGILNYKDQGGDRSDQSLIKLL